MRYIFLTVITAAVLSSTPPATALPPSEPMLEACEVTNILPSTLNLKLYRGEQREVEASVMPEGVAPQSLSWRLNSSSGVADLTPDGHRCVIKGLRAGKDILIIESENNVKARVNISVKDILPTSIELSSNSTRIAHGETAFIKARVIPEDSHIDNVNWEVLAGGENARISYGGNLCKIIGEKAGCVTIRASTEDGRIQSRLELNIDADNTQTAEHGIITRVLSFGGCALIALSMLLCAAHRAERRI